MEIKPAFDGNIRYSLDEITEMLGMTSLNMSEVEQIEKSLTSAKKKLAETRERIK